MKVHQDRLHLAPPSCQDHAHGHPCCPSPRQEKPLGVSEAEKIKLTTPTRGHERLSDLQWQCPCTCWRARPWTSTAGTHTVMCTTRHDREACRKLLVGVVSWICLSTNTPVVVKRQSSPKPYWSCAPWRAWSRTPSPRSKCTSAAT